MKEFDYVVIGSGPGGYVSAIRASQLGLKTAVIEKAEVGGICLNWGCIPTKSLLHDSALFYAAQHANFIVKDKTSIKPNVSIMVQRSRDVAKRLSSGITHLFKKYGVTLIQGAAFIESASEITVTGNSAEKIRFKNLCIATGASAKPLPFVAFSPNVLSYREAMVLQDIPGSILIVGAGAIGLEFADYFNSVGVKTTVVEAAPQILPTEEPFCAQTLKKALEKKGITISEGVSLTSISDSGKGIIAKMSKDGKETEIKADKCLLATGVSPNTNNIGLENLGIKTEKGFITIDKSCRVVGFQNVFAIGDITGGKLLAHKASHEGLISAESAALKKTHPISMENIPGCIYTSPQVASIGYSAKELKEKKIPFTEGAFPFAASGKALAIDEGEGLVKVYYHKETAEILGAHMVGPEVTELICNIALARTSELTPYEFAMTVFPHPTISEAIAEAFAVAEGKSANF